MMICVDGVCCGCDSGCATVLSGAWCFFFKQKTAYEGRISDWSSDVCSSDLLFGLPLLSGLGEAGFSAARLVGPAPGPTAVFTLALLLLLDGRPPWLLLAVPLLWGGVPAVVGWVLGVPDGLAVALLILVTFGLLVWKARGAG